MAPETATRTGRDTTDAHPTAPTPTARPGPGTRGHAARQASEPAPRRGLHPALAAVLVAVVGLAVVLWDPLGTEPAPTTTSAVADDLDVAQQEKALLVGRSAGPASRAADARWDDAAILAGEKVALGSRGVAVPVVSDDDAVLADEKVALATRGATAPVVSDDDAVLAVEKADLQSRGRTTGAPLTPAEEKAALVARGD